MPPLSEPTFALTQSLPSSHNRRGVSKRLPRLNLSMSVSFDEEAEMYCVEPNTELSPEEIENTWYNGGQFKMIKKSTLVLVKMMRRGKCEETDEYSFRGLEHRTKEGSEARQDAKERAADVLFLEVRRQKVEGIEDPEHLAELLNECTAERQHVALQLAKADQEAVIGGSSSFSEENNSQDMTSVSSQAMSIASAPDEEESSSHAYEGDSPLESDQGYLELSSPKGRRRPGLLASHGTSLRRTMSPHGLRNLLRRPKRDPVTGKRQ